MSLLSVHKMSASIAGQLVVEEVSFDIPETGITALLGRNGVGKTSTLRGTLGLIERQGKVEFDGQDISSKPTNRIIQMGIGYVPEDREVFSSLTVAENLKLAARKGLDSQWDFVQQLFPDLFDRLSQKAGTLSGGQQQMVSLARALINENKLLLVDEPTKGLAPKLVQETAMALQKAAEKTPMLLVEQNLRVVRQLAEDAIVLEGGRVVFQGKANDLLSDEKLTAKYLGVGGSND